MSQDWNIRPRSRVCQRCDRPFEDGEPYYTRLCFTDEGYVRTDCCQACWPGEQGAGGFGSWQGVFRLPPPEPDRTVKKETAESLFRRLLERKEAGRGHALYILAVMLERQRLLVEREVRREDDGARTLVYEHKRTGEAFLIPDPQLRLDRLEKVQAEVSAMLAGEPDAQSGEPQATGGSA